MKFIVIAAAIVASLLVATGVQASPTPWDDQHDKDNHHDKDNREDHHDKDNHDDHDNKKHKPSDDCWNKVDYWSDKDECKSYYQCLSHCHRSDWDGRKKCRDHNFRNGCDDHYHYYNDW